MLIFACVKQGSRYGAEYVNRLYAMIARNLDAGTEGRFVCFTDDPQGIREEVRCYPLPSRPVGVLSQVTGTDMAGCHDRLEGWWSKLWLFGPHQKFRDHDRVVYFDLDTVIVGDLDEIVKYDGQFAILRDFYRSDGWQSSVMLWRGDFGAQIWWEWVRAHKPHIDGGDQAWIERVVDHADILQDIFPGKFVSYKEHCKPYPPEGSAVCVFHGDPKPDDCGQAWVAAMWSESDTGHFALKMIANVTLDQIREQSRLSAARGLPRLKSQPARDGKVILVGGGPSLKDAATLHRLRAWAAEGAAIWAMNGTLKWLRDHDIEPDAFVLLDARADNARFLDSRFGGIHYVASQCGPDIYRALEDKHVVRFDLDTMGDCGTTVGTYAMAVAFTEGYRELHLVGYDSSYRGDEGHAYQQPLNADDRVVDAHIGDRTFRAAPWMVRQAQDFEGIAGAIVEAQGAVYVHGDGLLPEVARSMIPAARIRAQEVLRRLPPGRVMGVEIGVFAGQMSRELLQRPDLHLMMVDSWEGGGVAYADGAADFHAALSADQQARFMDAAIGAVKFANGRASLMQTRSDIAAELAADGMQDFVFIDADHSYEGCRADIAAWHPKVKPSGLLCGHDYEQPDFPGVKKAVDEFARERGLSVELGDNFTWFIRL